MRPAFSVIFFTVLSGAGLGALAWIVLLDAAGTAQLTAAVSSDALARPAIAAIVLVVAGLCCSTLHLANPRNAWRSLARWRTSWLSREAALAVALLPLAALYVLLLARGVGESRLALGALVVVLAWAMLVCTAMIYASLKPIRQWRTARVPVGFVVLGHASGALVLLACLPADAPGRAWVGAAAAVLLLAAAVVKVEYWAFLGRGIGSVTLEQAIGVAHGVRPPAPTSSVMAARLLDVGHSRGTFLTHEFMTNVAASHRAMLRIAAVVVGLALPAVAVATRATPALAWTALALNLAGLVVERWLFFADARHTVRLYHGDART
jgi:sulfite dehydrogenase (quinone) subunit SoeC